MDPLRPEVDLCAVSRIFPPLDVPVVTVPGWINVIMAVVFPIAAIGHYLSEFPTEYRFHKDGAVQQVLMANWESQKNTMIFASDVDGMERTSDWFGPAVSVS